MRVLHCLSLCIDNSSAVCISIPFATLQRFSMISIFSLRASQRVNEFFIQSSRARSSHLPASATHESGCSEPSGVLSLLVRCCAFEWRSVLAGAAATADHCSLPLLSACRQPSPSNPTRAASPFLRRCSCPSVRPFLLRHGRGGLGQAHRSV